MGEACVHNGESTVIAQYETRELGIPVVIFKSVMESRCTNCGSVSHSIPFPDRLIAAAAVARSKIASKLKGYEIRFMRKALGLSAKDLASSLDVTPETVSRWENDRLPMGPAYEKMLRLMAGLGLGGMAPAVNFKADEVLNMTLRPILRPGEEVVLGFELVRFKAKADEPTTDAYTEEQRKAA